MNICQFSCQNFSKVMSFPNSTKDYSPEEVKIRNYSHTMKKSNKFTEWEQKATELLIELQKAKNQIAKLQQENISLKIEGEDLKTEHDNLKRTVEVNKVKIEKNLDELNVEINQREADLRESEKKCVMQKEQHAKEIEELKNENKKLKYRIKNSEAQMNLLKLNNATIQKQNEEYQQKLKQAPCTKGENKDASQQAQKPPDAIPKTFKSNAESENLLLSDIFFKPRSFNENEIFFESNP